MSQEENEEVEVKEDIKEETPKQQTKEEWLKQFTDPEVKKVATMMWDMNIYVATELPKIIILETTNNINQKLQEMAGGSPVATTGGGGWLNTTSQISEIVSKFQGPTGDEEELLLWRTYKKMALKKLITVGMKQMGLPVHEANDYHVKLER